MSVEHTVLVQQSPAQEAATRADVAARVRQAVEQARVAEQAAREAAREAQREAQEAAREARMDAQQAARDAQAAATEARADARAEALAMQPAPENVTVRDGHVLIRDRHGNIVQEINIPSGGRGLPPDFPRDIPPRLENVFSMFFVTLAVIAIGIPLARAFGRWLDRRGQRAPAVPADVTVRLQRIEEAVETVALEIERISEGQRFTSRLMAEMRQAPQLEGVRMDGTRIPEPRR